MVLSTERGALMAFSLCHIYHTSLELTKQNQGPETVLKIPLSSADTILGDADKEK